LRLTIGSARSETGGRIRCVLLSAAEYRRLTLALLYAASGLL
jgi:hypothetical protein